MYSAIPEPVSSDTNHQNKKRKVLLLGATGSIGSQTLDILREYPDHFELVGVSAGFSLKKLEEIMKEFPAVQAGGIALNDAPEMLASKNFIEGTIRCVI